MAEDVVVKEPLAPELLAGGLELTNRLRRRPEVDLACSLWIYTVDRSDWRLTIGTPLADSAGQMPVYHLLRELLENSWPADAELDLATVSVRRASHPFIEAIRTLGHFEIPQVPPGIAPTPRMSAPKKVSWARIGDYFLEDARIYFIK